VKTALVTGASGFIGGALSRHLEEADVRVYRLSRHAAGSDSISADLGGGPIIGLDDIRPEVVFHLAARVHMMDEGSEAAAEHFRVTVKGTRSLLQAAAEAGTKVFVFFSTCAVMAEGAPSALDETSPPSPTTPYGRAKLHAEELVLGMNGKAGMRTVCLRPPLVYGRGHKGHLPRMIRMIERGLFPPLPEYTGKRSMIHVNDLVTAALLVAQRPAAAGNTYIVAEPRAYSSREVYEIVVRALGKKPPTWHMPRLVLTSAALVGDIGERITRRGLPFDSNALAKISRNAVYSAAKIERELGFKPVKSFATAAADLVGRKG
jgi:nucleoside-diphosphate-sugar epimerase